MFALKLSARPARPLAVLILAAVVFLAACMPATTLTPTTTPSVTLPPPRPAAPTATPLPATPTPLPAPASLPASFDPLAKKLDYTPYTLADLSLGGLQAEGLTILAEEGITATLVDTQQRVVRLPFPQSIPSLRDSDLSLELDPSPEIPGFVSYLLPPERNPEGTPIPTATPSGDPELDEREPRHYMLVKLPIPDDADLVVAAVSENAYAGVMPGVPLAVALKADGQVLGAAPAIFLAGDQPAIVIETDGPTRLERNGVSLGIGRGQSGWQVLPPPIRAQRLAGRPENSWRMEQRQPESGGPWQITDLKSGSPLFIFDPGYNAWLPAMDVNAPGVTALDPFAPPQIPGLTDQPGTVFPPLYRFDANLQGLEAFTPAYVAQTPELTGTVPAPTLFLNELGAVVARWEPAAAAGKAGTPAGRLLALTDARGDLQIWSEMRNEADTDSFAATFPDPAGERLSHPVALRLQRTSETYQFLSQVFEKAAKAIGPTLSETEQDLRDPYDRVAAGFIHMAAIDRFAAEQGLPLRSLDLANPDLLRLVDKLLADWEAGQTVTFGDRPVQGFALRVVDPSLPLNGSPLYLDNDGMLTIAFPLLRTQQSWENAELSPSLNNQLAEHIARAYMQNTRINEFEQYVSSYPWYGLLVGIKIVPLALWGETTP